MKFDKIKNTETWKYLCTNPKFKEEFEKTVKKYNYYVDINELDFIVQDMKIIVSCKSKTINRDLDCQFKLFNQTEFSLDDNDYLIINEMKGNLESNYGHDFQNTNGGKINTSYSCWVYDADGIELSYQSYGDQYILDKETFDQYKNDFSSVVMDTYNPNLITIANKMGMYCHPNVVGNNGNFLRQIRDKDNLGIIEVSKFSFDRNKDIRDVKEEFYFNTFFSTNSTLTPDLMHIMSGYPFATFNDNHIKVRDEYVKLGLNEKNYKSVARDRFTKELMEKREYVKNNPKLLAKYDLMIEKIDSKRTTEKKAR